MSRSYRKSPLIPVTCADSEKKDKSLANRKWRRAVKVILRCRPFAILPLQREISNRWAWDKDGMQRVEDKKWLRK